MKALAHSLAVFFGIAFSCAAISPVLPNAPVDVSPRKEDFTRLIEKLLSAERVEAGDARWLIELARQYRERFGEHPWQSGGLAGRFHAGRIRELAFTGWLAGDEELAYRLMFEGYRRGVDEKFDPWFAAFAVASGRGERALADLETLRTTMSPADFGMKRLHLLRALGRGKEALDAPRPQHAPISRLELAIEQEAWPMAIDATVDVFEDAKLRDAARHFIAILSRDRELLGRHIASPNRTLLLLADDVIGFSRMILAGLRYADPIGDRELEEMAQDAALAASMEERLTQALANGEPVPLEMMQKYFRYPDLLPDRARAERLAIALAAAPRCKRLYGGSLAVPDDRVFPVGHKLVAAEALLNFGRGDAAFVAMRPVLEAATDWTAFPDPNLWGWGGYQQSLLSAYRQGGKLAALAWPELDHKSRMERLAAVMGHGDRIERAKGMLALADAHAAGLDKTGLSQWLWLPLHDLACGGGVPAETMDAARKLLQRFAPDERAKQWLEDSAKPVPFSLQRQFSPQEKGLSFKGTPAASSVSPVSDFEEPVLRAQPGHWNPESPDFVVLDGLAAVKALLKERHCRARADSLMRSIILRLSLDASLAGQQVNVTHDERGFQAGPYELFLLCAAEWNFPAEWLAPYAGVCWRPATGYADDNRVELAARAYAKAGLFADASRLQRIYLLRTLSPQGDDPAVYPREVAELVKYEALAAARRGDREATLRGLGHHLRLMPYQPEAGKEILAAWSGGEAGDLAVQAGRIIDAYWSAKLFEVPGSKTYAHWRDAWKRR